MSLESPKDWDGMARAGRVVGLALREMGEALRPGMTTAEVDAIGARVLARHGAWSATQRHYGFPGVNCISLNEEAVHGIPGDRALRPGDLVKLDVTAELDGYVADAAITIPLPPVSASKRRLCACAESAFVKALDAARTGEPVWKIGRAVEAEVRRHGFRVIRALSGHGVGRAIHEEPSVPNYPDRRARQRLTDGLVLTIEPIIAAGAGDVGLLPDGWTVVTTDGSLAAHYEHTLVITPTRPVLLTALSA